MAAGWYVAAVRAREEATLLARLAQLGVETYSPRIVSVRRQRGWLEPLFPGYLFCRCDPQQDSWPQVRWARGVKYFLGSAREPTPVEETVIEALRAKVGQWNAGGWSRVFSPGERVRITRGTLAGLEALFQQHLPARERCRVLVSLVGRWVPVTVPIGELESATSRFRFAEARSG